MSEISIIIPTMNRVSFLIRTMTSLVDVVGVDDAVEILVVDNGSTDRTFEHFNEIQRRFFKRCECRYLKEDIPGLLSARHRGAREAKGDILAYLDDDVLVAPTWLAALREAFSDTGNVLAGGPSEPEYEGQPPEWLESFYIERPGTRACYYLSLIDRGNATCRIDPCSVIGLNFSIRKHTLLDCGGFHPDCIPKDLQRYQGDGETGLTLKMREKGHRALHHPEMLVRHIIPRSRMTIEAFEARQFYQGVCNSFSAIRSQGALGGAPEDYCESTQLPRDPTIISIHERMASAHSAGFRFHQNECFNDPKLLKWVLKADYLDYALPDGWQKYTNLSRGPF